MLRRCSWLRGPVFAAALWALSGLALPVSAGPPAAGPPAAGPAAGAAGRPALPDYGGRDGALGGAVDGGAAGAATINPLAQAGRALEALVIVLIVVAGGLVLLKRSGLLKGDAAPTSPGSAPWSFLSPKPSARVAASPGTEGMAELLTLLGSQTLPHSPGAGLHLVAVGGRVLLLGATGQAVTLLTEVSEFAPAADGGGESPEEAAAFAEYLARVGVVPPAAPSARATLSAATDRLASLVNGRGE